ncbi:hypothetical protein Tco_0351120 [Tanacetum coccineum]
MHILMTIFFFDKQDPGLPQGRGTRPNESLCQKDSCNCSDNSFISDGANRYGARAMGAAPGIKSIWNSTDRAGGRPGKSSGNTLGKSQTIGTSFICFPSDLSSSFLALIISSWELNYKLRAFTNRSLGRLGPNVACWIMRGPLVSLTIYRIRK